MYLIIIITASNIIFNITEIFLVINIKWNLINKIQNYLKLGINKGIF